MVTTQMHQITVSTVTMDAVQMAMGLVQVMDTTTDMGLIQIAATEEDFHLQQTTQLLILVTQASTSQVLHL
ncbi:MAG: hypothetical protein RL094_689 [Candidatus Parcubacteria bacterium]